MDTKTKETIDNMPYIEMLRRVRYAPAGDPMFQGDTGNYFNQVFEAKRQALTVDQRVYASKQVGWERSNNG